MVTDAHLKISRLPLMGEDERKQIIHIFNAARATYSQKRLIHELLDRCSGHLSGGGVSYEWAQKTFTYAELNERQNQLARPPEKSRSGARFSVVRWQLPLNT